MLKSWFARRAAPPADELPVDFGNRTDYLFLPEHYSAKRQLYPSTFLKALLAGLVTAEVVLLANVFGQVPASVTLSGLVAGFYFSLMGFKLWVICYSFQDRPLDFTRDELAALDPAELPVYSILIPLKDEAAVIPQIISAMTDIDYPPDKLDIIITLEESDRPTRQAIALADPPRHFRSLILPDTGPKTKPKALNVAFPQTRGEYLVIYDAEIVPDPDQLKKAVLAFRQHPHIACLQTRLDHYNARQSLITKLFNAEFAFYYGVFLPGLQRLGVPLPLSGHSTHFRRSALARIGAWDPYNVTEDCDVGLRLRRLGYRTGMLASTSLEEATGTIGAWLRQRSRWMKGFVQTSLVHLRQPQLLRRQIGGWRHFIGFLMTVPGTVAINLANLVNWLLLGAWLLWQPPFIQALFPRAVLYVAMVSFVLGNLIFTYLTLAEVFRQQRYYLVKYCLLVPVYWVLLAVASTRACLQMITRPHHWEKTGHGSHLPAAAPAPAPRLVPADEPARLAEEVNA
ncbi:glycosyltransferase [Candidatus Parcubacteria bacterium]|nr:glycosyltransferase [Candidatus Parcubacteria bacterium]